ncbi:MAG: ABC transporter ATP-binding protein [Candidatus Poribacteria bacterium]|nr:ABC transporter ATP-binding protein [Candidatus Poribacteria bacterium]
MATVRLENLTKRFDDVIALDGVNLDIHDQEFFVLLGQTGAGKTTVLRCIAGLEQPENGSIYFDNERVNDLTPAERDVAFVFQAHILYPHLTVYENMAFPLHPRGLPTDEIDRQVKEIAAMLHIEHLLQRNPNQLSGGETQRVGLGRAMVRHPQLFLMDEPISNLDAKLRAEMRAEIKWRQRQLETTTLYVTHDQIEAMSMADRVAVLEAGRIQQVGTPTEIYDHPANLFVAGFIGSPSMNLIPCQLTTSGDKVYLKLIGRHAVEVKSEKIAHTLIAFGRARNLVLGVHPEDLIVTTEETPENIPVEVYSFEPLGAETIVDVNLGRNEAGEDAILKSRVDPTLEVRIGQTVWIGFVPERIHIFDVDTGMALC